MAGHIGRESDSSKAELLSRSNLRELELTIIENYLEEINKKEVVDCITPDIRIMNENKIVFEGSAEDPKARQLILKADRLMSYQGANYYLIKK